MIEMSLGLFMKFDCIEKVGVCTCLFCGVFDGICLEEDRKKWKPMVQL